MAEGYLMMVLHAHLPYVRHPEYEDFLEEDWFYEAITETYIPLISVFEGLIRDHVDFRITMSLTPPLTSMFADSLLQDRYEKHINQLIELAHKEIERTAYMPELNETAQMYLKRFLHCRSVFVDQYHKNLILAFKKFQDMGKLEIITCGATHGFMPLTHHLNAVNAQIAIAKDSYKRFFLRPPRGIWNGECGYFPGLEEPLHRSGIRYFFTESHGILYAEKRPKYGVFAPLYCKNGVAAFGRDMESGQAVWSSKTGYPGNPNYREFYRDIGFDLDLDYIRPYIHESGLRIMTGIKYYRITGNAPHKEPYNHWKALETAADHASNFIFNREKQIKRLSTLMDRPPLVVAPYDAELFGHWWYEGPYFIDYLFRKLYYNQKIVIPITPSEYLERFPENQVSTPSFSSWGNRGYSEVWLNGTNDWIYRHLHKCSELMIHAANTNRDTSNPMTLRVLTQLARELLLAQSSDWAFIMTTDTMVEYAVKRTKEHIRNFFSLHDMFINQRIDEEWLKNIEYKDNIFPELDYMHYADPE
ncbi:MAG: glycoside hydrolase [bacterium]|nr:MAG: glycoside hydrolase [bacterium]